MATRAQVTELLNGGHSYETAARVLEISPGLVFMIATGRPADGEPVPAEHGGHPIPLASPQTLVGPPPFNPTRNETVLAWVAARARRELR